MSLYLLTFHSIWYWWSSHSLDTTDYLLFRISLIASYSFSILLYSGSSWRLWKIAYFISLSSKYGCLSAILESRIVIFSSPKQNLLCHYPLTTHLDYTIVKSLYVDKKLVGGERKSQIFAYGRWPTLLLHVWLHVLEPSGPGGLRNVPHSSPLPDSRETLRTF